MKKKDFGLTDDDNESEAPAHKKKSVTPSSSPLSLRLSRRRVDASHLTSDGECHLENLLGPTGQFPFLLSLCLFPSSNLCPLSVCVALVVPFPRPPVIPKDFFLLLLL
jgi:hypothetical protein